MLQEEKTVEKKSKKPLVISLICGGSVLLAAIIIAFVLFLPFVINDPIDNTLDEIFFDSDVLEELEKVWEKSGFDAESEISFKSSLIGFENNMSFKLGMQKKDKSGSVNINAFIKKYCAYIC